MSSPMRSRTFVACACLLAATACHTEFRFDDQSVDGGGPGGEDGPVARDDAADVVAAAADALPPCQGIRCGYEIEACTDVSCELECPQRGQCMGLCGPRCTADCEENSQCSLVTGNDARVRCEPGARCLITLGHGGEGRCEAGSRGDFVCLSTCALLCDVGATCAFACSSNVPLAGFTGHASCP
jgi:hypothetical protein